MLFCQEHVTVCANMSHARHTTHVCPFLPATFRIRLLIRQGPTRKYRWQCILKGTIHVNTIDVLLVFWRWNNDSSFESIFSLCEMITKIVLVNDVISPCCNYCLRVLLLLVRRLVQLMRSAQVWEYVLCRQYIGL